MIPVAYGSAGPLLDIVVPFDGQTTGNTYPIHHRPPKPNVLLVFVLGYHATTPEGFADGIHTALTLPPVEELAMRDRARKLAVQKFSEVEFEKAWNESGWKKWLNSSP